VSDGVRRRKDTVEHADPKLRQESPLVAGRQCDNVPKGGRMRTRGCGYVVGQAETKKVIEGAWRRHRSWRVGRPKPGPASKAVRKRGLFVS
jgi:hypothetical protein